MAGSDRQGASAPIVWKDVPQRNANFTGRSDLLYQLRMLLGEQKDALVIHALQGYGGVGKTHLAIEYIYRYSGDYDLICWIPADQPALLRGSLASLAPRLGVTGIPIGRQEDLIDAVREALRRGEPYSRWLVVFDNADQPEDLRDLLPRGMGHVLVTSRNHRWKSWAPTLDVDVFEREESKAFLQRRVEGMTDQEADRLAAELGDLPLALEQASALMAETAMSVDTYLSELGTAASKILGQGTSLDYPTSVAAAWSVSLSNIRERTPSAMELLYRIAYFGPEPISLDLINIGRHVLADSGLKRTIKDPYRMSEAIRELARYALARIDNLRRTLQMHRITQRLIRDELPEETRRAARHDVHLLLGATDPDRPDDETSWPAYEQLLPHVIPAEIIECAEPDTRRLVTNMARYLLVKGDHKECERWIDSALREWEKGDDENDLHLLIMRRLKTNLLVILGRQREAITLSEDTLKRLREAHGPHHDETLILTNIHGGILRSVGRFSDAFASDQASLAPHRSNFGSTHPNTQRVLSNIALDNALASRYEDALRLDQESFEVRRDFYGNDAHWRVAFTSNAIARDLRLLGRYHEARLEGERVYAIYQDIIRQRILPETHLDVLNQARELAIARRKSGDYAGAFELATSVYQRFRDAYTEEHPSALAAAATLANCQRLVGEFDASASLSNETTAKYRRILGARHPFTLASALNTAIALRLLRDASRTRAMLKDALDGLTDTLGEAHHYTLTCATNLAASVAETGDLPEAVRLGDKALRLFHDVLKADHPHTLACAANLGIDLRALGETDRADELRADAIERFTRTLGPDYPDVDVVRRGDRLNTDFEPSAV
ncbi:FxSxx-COOH system tetratricopeptide repeat protein [Herbidospora daliensis]|uniref:FxSxx-COOH system tetratricopeptide repeat protein n=1 Tax=Herbidospora daliensis TaxID=295585 RepID=UPI0007C71879|nr:FxSxx-COOH system tetratricopeptide repeat protein [Herbidospora daliensis]